MGKKLKLYVCTFGLALNKDIWWRDFCVWEESLPVLIGINALMLLTVIKILLNVSAVTFDAEIGLVEEHWPVFGSTLTPVLWTSLIKLTSKPIKRLK